MNKRIVRPERAHPLERLPLLNGGFAPPPMTERERATACFPIGCGVEETSEVPRYHWDNRNRGTFALLQYTIHGEGAFEDGSTGLVTPLPHGMAFFVLAPGPTRYWLPEGGHWRQAWVIFSGELALHHARGVIEQTGNLLDLRHEDGVRLALHDLVRAAATREGVDFFQSSHLVYRLLMELRRWAGQHRPDLGDASALAPALSLIGACFSDSQLGVKELAAACGFSRFHFTRLFHTHTGSSPQAYLIQTRLQRALQLLQENRLPPKQIAAACGINDYSYFCLLFRRHYGITPGSIRKNASSAEHP